MTAAPGSFNPASTMTAAPNNATSTMTAAAGGVASTMTAAGGISKLGAAPSAMTAVPAGNTANLDLADFASIPTKK
uniref:Uncharacterized protein n=1 Tax=Panagrolaimus sp. ES5 TaxID=591445 RepID=A0AC34G781_9BILA